MTLKSITRVSATLLLCATMTACVSTKTVSKTQVNDNQIACTSIAVRIGEVRAGKKYAKANRGLSGANVAAALFFWPALLVNNSNTSRMIKSMDEREAILTGLYDGKDCKSPIPEYTNKEFKSKLKSGDTEESFG